MCTNRYSTHSSVLILKMVYHTPLLLLHRQEILHKINMHEPMVNIEGIAAVQHLISSLSDVGSYHIMYTGSAIVPLMTSREAHPRSTPTIRRIVEVAIGLLDSVFIHKMTAKFFENLQALHYQGDPHMIFLKSIFLHVTLPLTTLA